MSCVSFYFGSFPAFFGILDLFFSLGVDSFFVLFSIFLALPPVMLAALFAYFFSKFPRLIPRFKIRMIIGLIGLIATAGIQKWAFLNWDVRMGQDGVIHLTSEVKQIHILITCFSMFFYAIFAIEATGEDRLHIRRHWHITKLITLITVVCSGIEYWLLVSV